MFSNNSHKSVKIKSWVYIVVLLVNVSVFACIGHVYFMYINSYSEKLFTENANNVETLNAASANAAYTYTSSMDIKVEDIVNYITVNNLNAEEVVEYLDESNTNPDRQFQLILSGSYGSTGELSFGDYSGVSVKKIRKSDGSITTVKKSITYGNGYYDILRSFTDVNDQNNLCFTPEFTNPDTKLKCFAVYRHVVLKDNDSKKKCYTILIAINSQTALNAYNMQKKYDGQSTVLINENGDYIIKNSDYRNTNFYDYIVNYNGLSLDWRIRLQDEILSATRNGEQTKSLYYKNHRGVDCIFSTAVMSNGWYSITCVPLSSFNLDNNDANYSFIILVAFLALFVFDGIVIFFVWKIMNYNISVAEHATSEANQANQAKSRFLSTMTHELRTPLNAILGFASLSMDNVDDKTVLRDYLRKIDISSKLLLQLISDILDVSAIESNKLKLHKSEFNLAKLITSLSTVYFDQCSGKGIEFNVILKAIQSEILIGDSVRVNQILLNFLSNAVKFTPSKGRVTLRIETIERSETSVRIRFEVQDTGCGISDELKARLFKPFERTTGEAAYKYRGTGLGLSIAKNLTELMDGSISVESKEGSGSCFSSEIPFELPINASLHNFNPISNLRILAVISDDDEREYVSQILSNICVSHSVAGNAEIAMQKLFEERDSEVPFNLCILDWKMSDLNALDATMKIRNEFDKASLLIMILAYDLAEVKPQAMAAGADLVFGKPVFSSELYNALQEITSDNARTIPEVSHGYSLNGKRVLLVEDNEINVEIAQLMLEKMGLTVTAAEDGKIGLDKFLDSKKGYFDLILMDIQMPVMDGYQATAAIRSSSHPDAKNIPILAMTADAFSKDVEMAHDAGMNEHISKPIETDKLYEIIEKYIG